MEVLPYAIRDVFPEEYNFIYNSWIKSGYRSKAYEMVAKEIYTLNQHDIITSLLVRAKIIVVQELNNPENIYGYLVYDYVDGIFTVYYAYVKQFFRGFGLLKALLAHAGFKNGSAGFYTHPTKLSYHVCHKLGLLYNPYLLINPKYSPLLKKPVRTLVVHTKPELNVLDTE